MSLVAIPPSVKHFERSESESSRPVEFRMIADDEDVDTIPQQISEVEPEDFSDYHLPVFANCAIDGTEAKTSQFEEVDVDWTPTKEKRFHKLTIEFAKGTISQVELHEYHGLKTQRRNQFSEIAGEELLRQIQERHMLLKIKQTIEEYVEFYRSKSHKKISKKSPISSR